VQNRTFCPQPSRMDLRRPEKYPLTPDLLLEIAKSDVQSMPRLTSAFATYTDCTASALQPPQVLDEIVLERLTVIRHSINHHFSAARVASLPSQPFSAIVDRARGFLAPPP